MTSEEASCQTCRLVLSLFRTHLRLKDKKLHKEYNTTLELTPCDFVALIVDPNEKSCFNLELIRHCFHQCLTLALNGVSQRTYDTVLDYDPAYPGDYVI